MSDQNKFKVGAFAVFHGPGYDVEIFAPDERDAIRTLLAELMATVNSAMAMSGDVSPHVAGNKLLNIQKDLRKYNLFFGVVKWFDATSKTVELKLSDEQSGHFPVDAMVLMSHHPGSGTDNILSTLNERLNNIKLVIDNQFTTANFTFAKCTKDDTYLGAAVAWFTDECPNGLKTPLIRKFTEIREDSKLIGLRRSIAANIPILDDFIGDYGYAGEIIEMKEDTALVRTPRGEFEVPYDQIAVTTERYETSAQPH